MKVAGRRMTSPLILSSPMTQLDLVSKKKIIIKGSYFKNSSSNEPQLQKSRYHI